MFVLFKVIFLAISTAGIFGQNIATKNNDKEIDQYMEAVEQQPEQTQFNAPSQNSFYPSFGPFEHPPLGHSRPFFFNGQQEAAYSQRSNLPFQQQVSYDSPKYAGYKGDFAPVQQAGSNSDHVGLLGSGNFGVIRGGTFYNDNERGESSNNYDNDYYFHNGHGRPSFGYYNGASNNPRPYQHEQFANFRDFADINTPTDRQYSHYVVVYVNKNATKENQDNEKLKRPKNIIESLAMLDLETTTTEATIETELPLKVPEKKLSKSKRKLAKLLPEKKHNLKLKKKLEATLEGLNAEPLLALS